jgi:hypothetical protein
MSTTTTATTMSDNTKPKRPQSAYMFFSKAARSQVKNDFPDAKSSEIMKLLAERWKGLTEEDKTMFNKLAMEDKERYATEKPEKQLPIKKNVSAYVHFSNAIRGTLKESNPNLTFGEVSKLLSEKWKSCTSDEKEVYNKLAKEDEERYKSEIGKDENTVPTPSVAEEKVSATPMSAAKSKKGAGAKNIESKSTIKTTTPQVAPTKKGKKAKKTEDILL